MVCWKCLERPIDDGEVYCPPCQEAVDADRVAEMERRVHMHSGRLYEEAMGRLEQIVGGR